MNNINEKPKNSMEMLIETYLNPARQQLQPIPETEVVSEQMATASRSADLVQLQTELRNTEMALTKAGIELNQLPTDVTKRLFEKYQNIQLHLGRLINSVEKLLNP
jgi:hypothetical protein